MGGGGGGGGGQPNVEANMGVWVLHRATGNDSFPYSIGAFC